MFGKGLIKGLGITGKHLFNRKVTEFYPEQKPVLPPRTRSSMYLDVPKCTACGICANTCPNNVITITSGKDENNKRVLTGYTMDTGRCLFCGLCTEACPSKALHTTTEFENAVYVKDELLWDMMKKYKADASKQEEGKDNG